LAAGDPIHAVLEYKNALQIDVKSVKATLGLGKSYLAQKDFPKALGAFKLALELDSACDEARVQVAWLQVMGGHGQAALDELEQLKDPETYKSRTDIIKARALAGMDRCRESIDILTKSEGVETNKEGQMLLAYCLRSTGSADAVKKAVEQWRSLDPQDPSSYLFLAEYSAKKGEPENAISELRKMLDVNPEDVGRALLWAQSLEALGFIKEAEAAFESLKAGNESLSARADFWMRRKDAAKARSLLEELIGGDPGNVDAITRLARIYTDQSEFSKALDILERASKGDLKKPDRERVLLTKAVVKARQRDFESAKSICEAVLAENQTNMDGHLLLGKILLNMRKPHEAELHLSQAAAARPNDEEAQILLARSLLQNKNDSMAGDTLRRALEANPNSPKLRMELLRYHLGKNELDQASKVLDKGIELAPGDLSLIRIRGDLEASRKNWGKAEKDFRKIVEMRPEIPLGYMEMGRLMLAESKPDEATQWFKKIIHLENGWQEAVPALFQTYMAQGDRTAALNAVKTEAEKRGNSPVALLLLGQAYESTGDLPEAEKAYNKASELAPEWPNPYHALSGIYSQRGELSDAIARAEQAWKANPTIAVRTQLAIFYEHAERYEDAINAYSDLLQRLGRLPDLMNNLAYLYAESTTDKETLAKASKLIEEALIQNPDNPFFLDTAAWVAYKQGDLESAWNYAQDAGVFSERALHSLHTAVILDARGEREQALKYLNDALEGKSDRLDRKALEAANRLKKEWSGS
jgi:tetratricopeptide (TPR) repeat protein